VILVDSHTHLDDKRFTDDRDAVVQRAVDAGVARMLSIGTGEGPPDLEAAIRIAARYEPVYASVGIHPEHAPVATQEHFDRLASLLRHPKVLLLGEIGLDYYWKPYDAKLQADVFVQQMEIAAASRKPISIHTRDAWDDTIALLRTHWAPKGLPCIMHCFTGKPGAGSTGAGSRLLFELFRRRDVPESERCSRVGEGDANRSHSGGDRCSVPCSSAISGQA
jgi:TatD DNase family protein